MKAHVRFTLKSRKTALALQALQIYAVARGLTRDRSGADVAAHVENLRRHLGKRGRPRKQ